MEPPRPRRGFAFVRVAVGQEVSRLPSRTFSCANFFFSCELAFRGPVCNRLTIFPYGISRETRRAHPEICGEAASYFRLLRFFPSRRGCDFDRRRRFGVTPTRHAAQPSAPRRQRMANMATAGAVAAATPVRVRANTRFPTRVVGRVVGNRGSRLPRRARRQVRAESSGVAVAAERDPAAAAGILPAPGYVRVAIDRARARLVARTTRVSPSASLGARSADPKDLSTFALFARD